MKLYNKTSILEIHPAILEENSLTIELEKPTQIVFLLISAYEAINAGKKFPKKLSIYYLDIETCPPRLKICGQ